jgi:hypothetical protein
MEMKEENPFIGIRPFEEHDHRRFFGRDEVTAEVLAKLGSYDLAVISGPSGCGKTSLVRSGVVHYLKESWNRAPDQAKGLPLIVRSWGRGRGPIVHVNLKNRTIHSLFINILIHDNKKYVDLIMDYEHQSASVEWDLGEKEAIKWLDSHTEFRDELRRQILDIRSGVFDESTSFLRIVDSMSRVFNGVVIIFDQLEEILRTGESSVRGITGLIASLFGSWGVKILISLRSEYYSELRHIEDNIAPVQKAAVHLTGLRQGKTEDVFRDIGKFANIDLAANLFELLSPTDVNSDLSLLYFYQAVFSQMWEEMRIANIDGFGDWLKEPGPARFLFDAGRLRKAFSLAPKGIDGEVDFVERVFESAIFRLMDRVFLIEGASPSRKTKSYQYASVRIWPFLSSGGYKTTAGEKHLYKNIYEDSPDHLPDLGADLRKDFVDCLRILGSETLEDENLVRSKGANLLKRYDADFFPHSTLGTERETALWELTHDRLGPPLIKWSRRRKNTIADAICSPIPSRGLSPITVDRPQSISASLSDDWGRLKWLGCTVEAKYDDRHGETTAEASETPTFYGIRFLSCDFTGAVFFDCHFRDCWFDDCIINGAIFIACTFDGGGFKNISMHNGNSVGLFGVTFRREPTFRNCRLMQLTMSGRKSDRQKKCDVNTRLVPLNFVSDVHFRRCQLQLARFADRLEGKAGASQSRLIFENCSGGFISWDRSFQEDCGFMEENDKWPHSAPDEV